MRIVVCDDDWNVVRALQIILEHAGHEVIMCGDPLDAIDKVEAEQTGSNRVTAIISDWQMPTFDGLEVLEVIQQKCPNVRRILLTAAPNEPEVQAGVKSGLVQFLVEKPWTRGELKRALTP